jgi:phosphohistidine phosphatase
MNLYLLRHGIALVRTDPSVSDDRERPLSHKGIKRMRKAAKGLLRLAIPFDTVLTSPLLRARQTAEIVVNTLGKEALLEEISGLAPDSTVEHLMSALTSYQDRQHLLLVGHEPLLGELAVYLLKRKHSGHLTLELKKGSLCHIEIASPASDAPGKLRFLLTPKQLRSLA